MILFDIRIVLCMLC